MNKENRIRLLALTLALITATASPVTAFAAESNEITGDLEATGYSSLTLEVVDSGSEGPGGGEGENPGGGEGENPGGGDTDPSVLVATVPVELPVIMDLEGNITVPKDAVIINHVEDKGIEVTAIDVVSGADWEIADFSDDFSSKSTNTKEFGLMLRGDELNTTGEFELSAGNWNIPADGELPLNMRMRLPKHTEESKTEIATIGFTLNWSDTTDGSDPDSGAEIDPPEAEGKFEVDWENGVMLPTSKNHALFKWSNQGEDVVLESVESTDDTVASAAIASAQPTASGQASVEVTGNARGTATIIGTLSNGQTVEFDVAVSELDTEREPSAEVDSSLDFEGGDVLSPGDITVTIPIVNPDGSTTDMTITPDAVPDTPLQSGDNEFTIEVDVNGVTITVKIVITVKVVNPSNGLVQTVEEAQAMGFTFTSYKDGLTISKFTNTQFKSEINIPEQIGDFKVLGISDSAFYGQSNLKKVTFPDTVLRIGRYAFYRCTSLENIELPSGLEFISDGAFDMCDKLSTVSMPDSIKTIGIGAFDGTVLKQINYTGTCEEWNKVPKPANWIEANLGCVAVCSDGSTPVYCGPYISETSDWEVKDGILLGTSISQSPIEIPSCVNGEFITGLGNKLFYNNEKIAAYLIFDSIKVIPGNALPHSGFNFTGVEFAEGVLRLEDGCLSGFQGRMLELPKSIEYLGSYSLRASINLTSVRFKGTMEQWEAIEKHPKWASGSKIKTINCTDGSITVTAEERN